MLLGGLVLASAALDKGVFDYAGSHQIDRWLNWDRARQGTPRTYLLEAKDICHRSGRNQADQRTAPILPESTNGEL